MPRYQSLEARFWAKVDKTDGCWLWTGAATRGYGTINRGEGRGKNSLAHRVSWTLLVGPIPSGANVLHRCDNPPCVRPDHLFLGTQKDNGQDMLLKGRARTGYAKLTPEDAVEIRSLSSLGLEIDEIASLFPNVTSKSVWRVVTNRTFLYATNPAVPIGVTEPKP